MKNKPCPYYSTSTKACFHTERTSRSVSKPFRCPFKRQITCDLYRKWLECQKKFVQSNTTPQKQRNI